MASSQRAAAAAALLFAQLALALASALKQPNIVMILADDLDYMMQSTNRQYMPNVHSLIGDQGMELRNFVVSMAWCCPSRASLLTGKHVHNTNITSSKLPRGGAGAFLNSNFTNNYLPVWLQELGYNTYFTGKFLNLMPVVTQTDCPKGWTMFEGMLDSYNNSYQHWYTTSYYSNNCNGIQTYNKYQTHIMREKGQQYIEHAVAAKKPFYIQLAPVAPHDQGFNKDAVPAPGDEDAYSGASMPKSPNWGVKLPPVMYLSDTNVQYSWSNKKWLKRIRSLKALDDIIASLIYKLTAQGVMDNTYFIFTSDNGFHLGHHSIQYEKYTPYEEDVRVPFFIRGPTIPNGIKSDYQATMVDITATIVQLAGGSLKPHLDGVPFPFQGIAQGMAGPIIQLQRPPPSLPAPPPGAMPPPVKRFKLPPPPHVEKPPRPPPSPPEPIVFFEETSETEEPLTWNAVNGDGDMPYAVRDSILIEGWLDLMDPKLSRKDYRAVRVCTRWLLPTSNLSSTVFLGSYTCYKYTVWCIPKNPFTGRDTRFRELFDLGSDPHEINNLLPCQNNETDRLVTRLNAVLTALAYCSGATCRQPWLVLHPDGTVLSLEQAMDPMHDNLYASFTTFGYTMCRMYYNQENEIADPTIKDALLTAQAQCEAPTTTTYTVG